MGLGTRSSISIPIIGGYIADKIIGYRRAVVIGALLMTLGHAAMAAETPLFLYIGITLLILGNGFFKPNVTSIISKMYEDYPEKKDGAYTIFYMGVNMLQFWFAGPLFGDIGEKPLAVADEEIDIPEGDKLNPFSTVDKVLIGIFGLLSFVWILNDPLTKIGNMPIIPGGETGANAVILTALAAFIITLVIRFPRYTPIVRDRLIAVGIFAFFTVFFWTAFEQAAGSMAIFAKDYTARALSGDAAGIFKIIDTVLTIVPLAIITWVLYRLFSQTFKKIALSNIILGISFAAIWAIVIYKLNKEFSEPGTEVPATWFAGLILLGLGFLFLVFGSASIAQGAKVAQVSMVWLILAYLFHTLGELCLSPVGLSYVSKLVPGRMIAFMFGVWYLAIAIGNKLAHLLGGKIDEITASYSLSTFFLIFTAVPIAAGIVIMLLNPLMKKLMHGIR